MSVVVRGTDGRFLAVPPVYRVSESIVFISIHHKGRIVEAIVDHEDLSAISAIPYAISLNKGYPGFSYVSPGGKRQTFMPLHRYLTGCHPTLQVDHINGNKLDNRRCNLRFVTNQQNCQNQKIAKNNSTGVRGVSFHKRSRTYDANIRVDGKLIFLGSRKTLEDAATLAIEARKRYFPYFNEELCKNTVAH